MQNRPKTALAAAATTALAALVSLAAHAPAQSVGSQPADPAIHAPIPQPGTDNAAVTYWDAWAALDPDLWARVTQEQASDDWTPSTELTAMLRDNEEAIALLLRASRTEHCDWQIDFEAGIDAMLPHLGAMRNSARVLAADARRLAAAGEHDAAAERAAAVFRLARHVNDHGMIISPLVSAALAAYGAAQVEALDELGALTQRGRVLLLDAIAPFDGPDPFGVERTIRNEGRLFTDWLKQSFNGDRAGRDMLMHDLFLGSHIDGGPGLVTQVGPEMAVYVTKGEAELHREFDALNHTYQRVADAWSDPDRDRLIAEITDDIVSGRLGTLTAIFFPSVEQLARSETNVKERLATTAERLGSDG